MSDVNNRKSPLKRPRTAPVFWVLFTLLFVALLIANATAVFYQRKWHRQLTPLRTEVAELNARVQQLEDLRALANRKLEQEKKEHDVIRSMLKGAQSASDIPIDPTGKMHWASEDRWLGEDGKYSVFFSVPAGDHTFKATVTETKMVNPLAVGEAGLPTEEFSVVLKSTASYELRVRQLENTDEGCSFALQLFDQNKNLLDERKFRSQAKYNSMYSITNDGSRSADLNASTRAGRPLLIMNLDCPCPGELTNGFAIGCSVLSKRPENFTDALRFVGYPAEAMNLFEALPAENGSTSRVPMPSRYIRLDR